MMVTDKTFDVGKLFRFVSTLVILGGLAVSLYGTLAALGKAGPPALKAGLPDDDKELSGVTTSELPDARIPVPLPSVTERTTQLIGEEKISHADDR
jgi:hypothetical protein